MYRQRTKCFIKLFLVLSCIFMINCAGTTQKADEITDEQKEQDLIELLNARQVKPPDMVTETEKQNMQQRIANLENNALVSSGELNTLKSELLLKDEKIRQLEAQLKTEQAEEKKPPITEQAEKPTQPAALAGFEDEYKEARNSFEERKYKNSLAQFQELLKKNPRHALSDNCQYWIGECYFALKDYNKAIIEFVKVFNYLNSNKDDDAQIKLGICYYRLGDMEKTKEELTKLINYYPESEYVERAKKMIEAIG